VKIQCYKWIVGVTSGFRKILGKIQREKHMLTVVQEKRPLQICISYKWTFSYLLIGVHRSKTKSPTKPHFKLLTNGQIEVQFILEINCFRTWLLISFLSLTQQTCWHGDTGALGKHTHKRGEWKEYKKRGKNGWDKEQADRMALSPWDDKTGTLNACHGHHIASDPLPLNLTITINE
jgi:hypothetical protein